MEIIEPGFSAWMSVIANGNMSIVHSNGSNVLKNRMRFIREKTDILRKGEEPMILTGFIPRFRGQDKVQVVKSGRIKPYRGSGMLRLSGRGNNRLDPNFLGWNVCRLSAHHAF
jgi:hypothetical protein